MVGVLIVHGYYKPTHKAGSTTLYKTNYKTPNYDYELNGLPTHKHRLYKSYSISIYMCIYIYTYTLITCTYISICTYIVRWLNIHIYIYIRSQFLNILDLAL